MSDEQKFQWLRAAVDHLLHELRQAAESPADEVFCDQIDEEGLLERYLDTELGGENAAQIFPHLTNHLAVCKDCRETLDLLRHLRQTLDEDPAMASVPQPRKQTDWAKLVPPPKPGRPSLQQLLDSWVPRLRSAEFGTRSSGEGEEEVIEIPGIEQRLALQVSVEQQTGLLQGSIHSWEEGLRLTGSQITLYQIDPAAIIGQSRLTGFGTFQLEQPVRQGRYVLTIIINPESPADESDPRRIEQPLTILEPDLWR